MPRILIVDDAPIFLLLLSKLLAGEGYEVATAKHGAEALKILETASFDLLLSDMNMEPVNGLELLRAVKTSYADMPVIMVTAYETLYSADETERLGAFAYITKPFKNAMLFETVRRALEPSVATA
ncbi:MAG: response regulator [Kiritimatiellales bacterium]